MQQRNWFSHLPGSRMHLLWGVVAFPSVACLCFCGCMLVWLLIRGYFSYAGIFWLDLSCRSLFQPSDLHPHAANAAFLQDSDLFCPWLPNDRPDWPKTFWAGFYHHYAPPIEKLWSMDARILRKIQNGWRWQRLISQKPCTEIGWNCLGRFNRFLNRCMDVEKM